MEKITLTEKDGYGNQIVETHGIYKLIADTMGGYYVSQDGNRDGIIAKFRNSTDDKFHAYLFWNELIKRV